MTEPYSITAKYYDDEYDGKRSDLAFYLDCAIRFGGPILEIACGTGRILLPTARAGAKITGVDVSEEMLESLRGTLGAETAAVRERVTLHRGDMRNFSLGQKFGLITIPFRPLQHMHGLEDQIAALKNAREHLADDGVLVFDVFYPYFDMLYAGVGTEAFDFEWTSRKDPRLKLKRFFFKQRVDRIRQSFFAEFIYRTYEGEKQVCEEREPLAMSYYTYPHLRAIFRLVGLEIVEEYGDFTKAPLDNNAKEMIFVLKRA